MLESLLINLLAAILAIGIAALALPVLSHLIGRELPFGFLRVPGFWIGFSVVILLGSLLSGLYPAFVLSAFKPVSMLGAHKNSRLGKINLRRGLIVFQFLTSLLLISGTYLVYKQIMFMKHKELGIDMEKILVLQGPKNLDMVTFDAFRTEVARHHSIAAVTGSQRVPGRGISGDGGFRILGKPESANQYGRMISTGFYFPETYDLEFLAGGSFSQNMSTEDRPVIINEEAALTFGFRSPEDAIQETLVNAHRDKLYTYRVVGVVKNFHWHSLRDAHTPYLFRFMPQDYYKFAVKHISLKMSLSNIQESLAHIEKTYKSFFPGNTFNYFFLDDDFNNQYRADLQFGKVFLSFTVLAILIACIGLLALVSYSATLRIKEFGIRKVFGAGIGNIMMLLSREYVVLLLIATILAIPAIIYWGSSWLENYAFRTTIGFDLFIIPTLTLLLISFLTVSHRTYAAAKANPVDSLRTE